MLQETRSTLLDFISSRAGTTSSGYDQIDHHDTAADQQYELTPFLDDASTTNAQKSSEQGRPRTFRESLPAILFASFVSFGGILYGYDSGVISGILEMKAFCKTFGQHWDNIPSNIVTSTNPPAPGWALATADRSLIVSILSVGTFFGCLSAAPAADILGRRWGLQLALAIFTLGVTMQCAASGITLFALGRVFAGERQ